MSEPLSEKKLREVLSQHPEPNITIAFQKLSVEEMQEAMAFLPGKEFSAHHHLMETFDGILKARLYERDQAAAQERKKAASSDLKWKIFGILLAVLAVALTVVKLLK